MKNVTCAPVLLCGVDGSEAQLCRLAQGLKEKYIYICSKLTPTIHTE